MTKPRTEYHTFEFLRRTLIQVHNRNVRRQFSDIKKPDSSPRNALNQASLIRPNDPMGTVLMRLGLYYFALGHIDQLTTVATPEIFDIRKEQNIPQLVLTWRSAGGPHPSSYAVTIPHYNGQRHPQMPISWHKGDHVGTTWLNDNSHIRLYANSVSELDSLLLHFQQYVTPGKISHTSVGQRKGKPVKKVTLHPVKAQYYHQGIGQVAPDWICYFDKNGVCN